MIKMLTAEGPVLVGSTRYGSHNGFETVDGTVSRTGLTRIGEQKQNTEICLQRSDKNTASTIRLLVAHDHSVRGFTRTPT